MCKRVPTFIADVYNFFLLHDVNQQIILLLYIPIGIKIKLKTRNVNINMSYLPLFLPFERNLESILDASFFVFFSVHNCNGKRDILINFIYPFSLRICCFLIRKKILSGKEQTVLNFIKKRLLLNFFHFNNATNFFLSKSF